VSYNKLITPLILLVIGLAVILWIVAAKFVTSQHSATNTQPVSEKTNTSIITKMEASVRRLTQSANTPDPALEREEKAKASAQASGQFGAALERAGIETQASPSH
jgi:hypothetical protein